MPKRERRLPLRQVIKVMKAAFEKTFQCEITLYDNRDPTIATVGFIFEKAAYFTVHIFEKDDEEVFRFLGHIYVSETDLRAYAALLPKAFELLAILQLL